METQKRCHILPRWWCVSCTLQAAVWRTIEQLATYSLLRGISKQITVFAYNATSYFDFFQATIHSECIYVFCTDLTPQRTALSNRFLSPRRSVLYLAVRTKSLNAIQINLSI